jgi:RNA polymerase sigma-70 factor (ECF subfamily)
MSLSDQLTLAIADEDLRASVRALPDLEATLAARLAEARALLPRAQVDEGAWLELVARWLGAQGRADVLVAATAPAKLGELFLACGCGAGDPAALAAFEARYFAPLASVFGRMQLPGALADEAAQLVRMKLLVGEGGEPPRVVAYAAGGDLQGLVRVAATRTAISLLRKRNAEQISDDDDLVALVSPETDAEKRLIRSEHRTAVQQAFKAALGALDTRARNLLRQSLLDQLSIDELGVLYRVHRSTAARWLEQARERLLDHARAHLGAAGRLHPDELDSLLGASRSQMDLSLARILSPPAR